ncbi:Replication factor A protein 3 [Candida viswanathii]|uniref:Replication factor A protein 3 n=1 Tax=Candida viswanathii TaxID=5486 RepID=A0A367YBN6_9ASCO|nr:Replication factor A protein 3 [Candida viswanathii]
MEATNIRVDASLIQNNSGRIVRIMGKCESFDQASHQAIILANGTANLDLSQVDDVLEIHKNYEFIGKAGVDQKIRVYSVVPLSDNLDLNIAAKLVLFANQVPELYTD